MNTTTVEIATPICHESGFEIVELVVAESLSGLIGEGGRGDIYLAVIGWMERPGIQHPTTLQDHLSSHHTASDLLYKNALDNGSRCSSAA